MKEFNWIIIASVSQKPFNHQVLIPSFHDHSMPVTLMHLSNLKETPRRVMRTMIIRPPIRSRRDTSTVAYTNRILLFAPSFVQILSGTSHSSFVVVYKCSSTICSKRILITQSLLKMIRSRFILMHFSHSFNLLFMSTTVHNPFNLIVSRVCLFPFDPHILFTKIKELTIYSITLT